MPESQAISTGLPSPNTPIFVNLSIKSPNLTVTVSGAPSLISITDLTSGPNPAAASSAAPRAKQIHLSGSRILYREHASNVIPTIERAQDVHRLISRPEVLGSIFREPVAGQTAERASITLSNPPAHSIPPRVTTMEESGTYISMHGFFRRRSDASVQALPEKLPVSSAVAS